MCRLLLLLNADQLDNLTVSFIPLLDIGNKEEVDSGEANRGDDCDVHDADINHENKAPVLTEAEMLNSQECFNFLLGEGECRCDTDSVTLSLMRSGDTKS